MKKNLGLSLGEQKTAIYLDTKPKKKQNTKLRDVEIKNETLL